MRKLRRVLILLLALGTFGALFVFLCDHWITQAGTGKVYDRADHIPKRRVGLVLGASKDAHGGVNLFFLYRVRAAAALYHAGKVRQLLVSGDNSRDGYDESSDMRVALVALGVPDSCITSDFAGLRTLDSVVRCKRIFGVDSVTVISQQFHNERALYLASHHGLEAIAFNAEDVPSWYATKTNLREWLARVKAVLDVHVFDTDPKYLGKKESL